MVALLKSRPTFVADDAAIATFRAQFHGEVLQPYDPGYDEARTARNGLIDRYPGLIARCTGQADVVAAVNFARDHDLLVSVRGGGHNVAGSSLNDCGIVIDLSLMNGVRVDPVERSVRVRDARWNHWPACDATDRTVRAEGGATWGDVDRETQLFGLATPGGNVSSTGVGGLTLGGGMGHLRRKYGFSIDNLLSADIVTADGQVRTVSATEHPDLFWAIRGGGGNFGVVTSFEFRLHPVGPLVAMCAPVYALEDAATVLPAWRDFMDSAPEEISSIALLWGLPEAEIFPPELHQRPILILVALYAGPADEGERALQPLRELGTPLLDMSQTMPYTAMQNGFDGFFPKGLCYYWKSLNIDRLAGEALDDVLRYAAERPTPQTMMALWHQGGAPARVGAEETAFGDRTAPYLLSFEATWTDPEQSADNIAWTRAAWEDMHRHSSGQLYLNFAGFGEEKEALVRAAYGSNYDRLTAIKATYDPDNLFRVNQNIRPAR